ncbi:MAG: TonB-dependent receptor [Prevotella sp.]|nr:TonB-dependent receptor [Prevotella sp.]
MKTRLLSIVILGSTSVAVAAQESAADSASLSMDEVVVTGTRGRSDVRHLPMTVSVIGHGRLTANYDDKILPSLTQQVPGLFATSRGLLDYGVSRGSAGSMKVRGIGGMADLLVLVDGLPQYAGLYGHPIADAYQTLMADKVEVLRGPASVIYGSNAMGGVVNIVTRTMLQDGVSTHLQLQGGSYGTLQASATNRFRHGKFFSIAGADYGRTDGHRSRSGFEQISGFAKLGYDFTPYWTLTGDVNITYFESANPGEVTNPYIDNDMMITRGMAALSLINDYGRANGAFRLFYNWGHHHINDGYHPGGHPGKAFYMHDDRMGGFSLYQSIELFKGNRTTAGIDYQHFGGHAWNRAFADGTETDIVRKAVNEVAGYIDFRQDVAPWLTLDAGVRLDHHSVTGNEWIPQGGFTVRMSRQAELKGMVSKGFRNPTLREMYMYGAANAGLRPERMMSYEISYSQRLMQGRLRYGVSLFYLKADNMVQTMMIGGRQRNTNTGNTENSGIEAEAAYLLNNHLTLNTNYSYLHMSHPQLSAPAHKLFLGAGYSIGRFRFNGGLQYVADLYTATGSRERKEDFVLLDLTADCRLAKGLNVFAKGENLLAQKYETFLGFPMPRTTFMGGISWNF